jgi:antirestriction protein ArdC
MQADIAATITATILAKLEAGTKPWVQPWTGAPISRPLRHCGSAYRGINTLLLWMVAEERGYASPYWMTYRQAELLKGQVRKGEKCARAVFYKVLTPQETATGDDAIGAGDAVEGGVGFGDGAGGRTRRLLRQFAVFNADQIEGLPERYYPELAPRRELPESDHRQRLDAVFASLPAIVRHNGYRAYYNLTRDEIVLPPIDRFNSYSGYFAVRAHETLHWSGAEHRLGRKFGKHFGDAAYAMEELVADIGAAILGAALALPEADLDNHAAYLGHWVKILKTNKNAILTAASKADEAVNFIMGFAQPGVSRIVEREPQLLAA